MSRKFQTKAVSSSWFEETGFRFDCNPYMSGAFEARELLDSHQTDKLSDLTEGYNGGIYNGPQFVRNYVDDPDYGVPFLTTSTMLQADLSNIPMISKKDAQTAKLSYLEIEESMTLITCSGSIGRMTYARKDMNGFWSNQDIIKVVANKSKVLPGYLYAFLSTRFGIPLIISGTYGAIIQHIEPHHIADLPVPRLGAVEEKAHELVQRAADLRVEASIILKQATKKYLEAASIEDITPVFWHENSGRTGFAANISHTTLRASNYIPLSKTLEERIKNEASEWLPIIDVVEPDTLRRGPRIKRIDAEQEYGVEFIGQGECFNLRPNGRWMSKQHLPDDNLLFPPDGAIMIAAQGGTGEHHTFGQARFIVGKLLNCAYSEHFLRVIGKESIIPRGALFAFLQSQIAFRIRRSYQFGSMQQDFHPELIKQMPIPIINYETAKEVDAMVRKAYCFYDQAIDSEDEACTIVERAIEEGGS